MASKLNHFVGVFADDAAVNSYMSGLGWPQVEGLLYKDSNDFLKSYDGANWAVVGAIREENSGDLAFRNTVTDKDLILGVNDGGVQKDLIKLVGASGTIELTGTLYIGPTPNITALEILSVGTANYGIRMDSAGLSGSSDYFIYASAYNYWRADGVLTVEGSIASYDYGTNSEARLSCVTWNDQIDYPGKIRLWKSHSDSIGSTVTTINNEILGEVEWKGVDSGTSYNYGAIIRAIQDGSASTTVPTEIEFLTADGTNDPVVRLRIGKTGIVSAYSNSYAPLKGYRTGLTADALSAGIVSHSTKATNMGSGFGTGVAFEIEDDLGVSNVIGLIGASWSGGDNHGQLEFWPYLSGIGYRRGTISPNGTWTIGPTNNVTALVFGSIGTATRVIDASGSNASGTDALLYFTDDIQLKASGEFECNYLRANSGVSYFVSGLQCGGYLSPYDETSLLVRGREADDATAVAVKFGNSTALSNAAARIAEFHSDQFTGSNIKAWIDKDGMGGFDTLGIAASGVKQSNNSIYSKGDNKLYYKDSGGTEHEVAFV